MASARVPIVEWTSSRESSTMPTVITAVPTIGNGW